jgi:phosphoglycolate phosphatase
VDRKTAGRIVEVYRGHYREIGLYQNVPYPGISELLAKLKRDGARLAVASAKPQPFTEEVLSYFNLAPYFDLIVGSEPERKTASKSDIIRTALGGFDPENAVMVGDSVYDAQGAFEAETGFVGVLYGFGKRSEMEEFGFTRFARTVEELGEILFSVDS